MPIGAPPKRAVPVAYLDKLVERARRRHGKIVIAARVKPPRHKPPKDAQFFRVHGVLCARVPGQRLYKYHPTKGWRGEAWGG
jgi:hypothetical protein